MQNTLTFVATMLALSGLGLTVHAAQSTVQLGPRPFYLVEQLEEGDLKNKLAACVADIKRYRHHDFSIGHRGAGLQFPEHTKESYEAAHRMGAGIIECDVTFTKDGELVCRHAQCDLHTTTNILATDLAAACRVLFTPAIFDANGNQVTAATARCCTTDLTLAEFKSLKGKMDASNPNALTVEEFLSGTPSFRTELYATGATLLSHRESITLIGSMGAKFTPELKGVDRDSGNPLVKENNGFGDSGLDQQRYGHKMIQEYLDANIDPAKVFPQSFNLADVLQWIHEFPTFGLQAVYLISENPQDPLAGPVKVISEQPPTLEAFVAVRNQGVNIVAPPMPVLLTTSANGKHMKPSLYAERARQAGFDLIAWTTERSGRIVEDVLVEGGDTFYYQTTLDALTNDGDILRTIDVLAQDVGIIGLFSDWPATTTFYANCLK
jgi:glycerophosphoryl diester phosphodiesterase